MVSLTYRRPSKVSSSRDSLTGDEKQRSINESLSSGSSCSIKGIPEALSFERVVHSGACPPCSVRNFMNYLKYIECSAENLQFYLWHRDYVARFDQLPESEKVLANEWTRAKAEAAAVGNTSTAKVSKQANEHVKEALKDTDFESGKPKPAVDSADPFDTPDKTPSLEEKRDGLSEYGSSTGDGKTTTSGATHRSNADQAFDEAGMKWQPFTMQPYRDEINRIVSIYIAAGSPRELNMSARERTAVLHALQNTTHPSAFKEVITSVVYTLRRQSHPNFIRWTICNGNRPRVVFARGLGVGTIVLGFLADLLITLSSANRGYRVLPFLLWFIGIATLIAAWKGMCVVLHGLHHRHIRPWELFSDETDEINEENDTKFSTDSFLSQSTNSWEDEPWVAKYNKRNIIRKVFDRQRQITEPALRQIQDTIFLQSILGAFVLSVIIVAIFLAVPAGNLI